jgi:hypothetical protein
MNVESPTCPYCNALVEVSSGTPAGTRIECPRCGEAFILRAPVAAAASASAAQAATETALPGSAPRPARSIWLTVGVVVGVMATMAAVGLLFALATQGFRRDNDRAMTKRFKRSPFRQGVPETPVDGRGSAPTRVVPAHQLPILGWLPPSVNSVAFLDFNAMRASPAGKTLLDRTFQLGTVEWRVDAIARWTGLAVEELDQVVLGLRAEEPLSALLAVRTRKPYELRKILETLRAERIAGAGPKTLYRIRLQGSNLPVLLWPADERTLVAGLVERVVQALPAAPRDGADHLPAEVRTLLRERIEPGAPAWVAGQVEDWDKTAVPSLLGRLAPEDRDRLLSVRGFALCADLDRRATVKAALRARSEAAAEALDTWLVKTAPGPESAVKTARDGRWLTWQYRPDFDKLSGPGQR